MDPEESGRKGVKIKDVSNYLSSLQKKTKLCTAVYYLNVSSASAWMCVSVTHAGPCTVDQLVKTKSSSCYPPGSHTAVHRTTLCMGVCGCGCAGELLLSDISQIQGTGLMMSPV